MFFDDIIFNINNRTKLFNVNDGLAYGNMFKDEYIPYKNYMVYKLNSTNKKDELLLKIYEYNFALNDLSLYLDLHPNDNDIYNLFKEYTLMEEQYMKEYERLYGPLEINETNYDDYMWDKGPWPFIEGGI